MEILLADDDTGTRELIKRALESDGHTVSIAQDGAEAADKLAAEGSRFDLLIADVDMPGLDGLAVAKKAREAAAAIGVVLISAHESELERASDVPGGNVETLPKPFALEDLRSKVAKVRG
jgi:two-component system, cell cycle response regulator CpdR